jgi:hypothetical protein
MSKEERLNVEDYPMPQLEDIEVERRLDHEIKTLGHITLEEYNELEKYRTEEERMAAEMTSHRNREEGEEDEEEDDKEEEGE